MARRSTEAPQNRPVVGQAIAVRAQTTAMVSAQLFDSAKSYAAAAKSDNTRRAYRNDWQAFEHWCATQGLPALPAAPPTLALYVTALADAGRKPSTIERALTAISQAHRAAGQESPRGAAPVRAVMQGVKRTKGTAPAQKSPVIVSVLCQMVEGLPPGLKGIRDRAVLLIGFAGAFRRSELVALNVEDLEFTAEGIAVTIRRSKGDQEGAGQRIGIPFGSSPATCPVKALRAWLEAAPLDHGPVFRSVTRHGHASGKRLSAIDVARIVKARAVAAGLDATRFSGHSLRAGLATSAAKAGKSERTIMGQTRHRSVMMVRRYIREAELFADNAAAGLL